MSMNLTIGNICQKFNNQDINIVYESVNSLFDYCISLLPFQFFIVDDSATENIYNLKQITPDNKCLYQYTTYINNSVLALVSNNQLLSKQMEGLSCISCIHQSKPTNVKKEDLYLIKENLKNVHKVFFDEFTQQSWRFDTKYSYIKYGIPPQIIQNNTQKNNDTVLVLNLNKNQNISMIESILSNNEIKYKLANNVDQNLIVDINTHKVCLELQPFNLVNVLVSSACGANIVAPQLHSYSNDYNDIDNLYVFSNIEEMVHQVKLALSEENKPNTMLTKYNFDVFSQQFQEIIAKSSREAVIL